MNRATGHSHRDAEYRHALLQQRLMTHELDVSDFTREVFGDVVGAPVQFASTVIRLVDEAEASRDVDDVEEG
jgi:hypothetical protein